MASSKRNDFEKRKPTPRVRWDEDYFVFPYLVRKFPLPAPTPGGTDDPVSVLQVNQEWLSHVLGALSVLEQRDSWTGTDAEIYAAQQAVEQIIASVQSVADFLEDARDLFRVKPGEPYILQRLNLDTGQYEDFLVLGDISLLDKDTLSLDTTGTIAASRFFVRNPGNAAVVVLEYSTVGRLEYNLNGVRRITLDAGDPANFFMNIFSANGVFEGARLEYIYDLDQYRFNADVLVQSDLFVSGTKNFLISHPLDDNKQLRYTAVEGPQAYVTHTGTATLVNGTALVDVDGQFGLDDGTLVALVKTSTVRVWLQAGRGQWPTGNLVYDIVNGLLRIRDVTPPGVTVATSNIDVHWQLTAVRDDAAIRASASTDDNGNLITQIAKQRTVTDVLAALADEVDALVADEQPREAVEQFIKQQLRGVRGWNDVGDVPQAVRDRINAYLNDAYGVV